MHVDSLGRDSVRVGWADNKPLRHSATATERSHLRKKKATKGENLLGRVGIFHSSLVLGVRALFPLSPGKGVTGRGMGSWLSFSFLIAEGSRPEG
jgi:hypothetical protein